MNSQEIPHEEPVFSPGDYNDLVFLNVARTMKLVDIVNHLMVLEASVELAKALLQNLVQEHHTTLRAIAEKSGDKMEANPLRECAKLLAAMNTIVRAQQLPHLQECRDVEQKGDGLIQQLDQEEGDDGLKAIMREALRQFRVFWESSSKVLVYEQALKERDVSFKVSLPLGKKRIDEFAEWVINLQPEEFEEVREGLQRQLAAHLKDFRDLIATVVVMYKYSRVGAGMSMK